MKRKSIEIANALSKLKYFSLSAKVLETLSTLGDRSRGRVFNVMFEYVLFGDENTEQLVSEKEKVAWISIRYSMKSIRDQVFRDPDKAQTKQKAKKANVFVQHYAELETNEGKKKNVGKAGFEAYKSELRAAKNGDEEQRKKYPNWVELCEKWKV